MNGQGRPARIRIGLALGILAALIYFVTVPKLYYISQPGFARSAEALIRLPSGTSLEGFQNSTSDKPADKAEASNPPKSTEFNDGESGDLQTVNSGWYYTAVRLDRVNALQAVLHRIKSGEVSTVRAVLGQLEEPVYMERMKTVMQLSLQQAAEASLGQADVLDKTVPDGVAVRSSGSVGDGLTLETADMILRAGGETVRSLQELLDQMKVSVRNDSALRLEILRDGQKVLLEGGVRTAAVEQLQLSLENSGKFQAVNPPEFQEVKQLFLPKAAKPLTWSGAEAGGPSAGLMAALALYDRVVPGDLLDGRTIAGTGTIDAQGRVGAVGGVVDKVNAAAAAGAGWFLVPSQEADEAERAAKAAANQHKNAPAEPMIVIGVKNLADAIQKLGG
ncbi:hypothetical protein M3223_01645 [Paenibacillus pasadenensis]|uniref:S16 family serine protease n=1 Tax=Paenibacillus pasadenensis TaxID=217090 RepID=UPI00203CC157|nr:S16 family serine protease [Paenibacillus pasadenensis]MCM3746051.1 hypothetical protein [Paenibacillus pasadenensis]